MSKKYPSTILSSLLFLAVTSGCVSPPVPRETIGAAQMAIKDAELAKAATYASGDLSKARDKLNQAENYIKDDKRVLARRYAEQAIVDANVAQVKAQEGQTSKYKRHAQGAVQDLQLKTNY